MKSLILINLFFALIMAVFLILPVASNWAWLGLIIAWCVGEGVLARDHSIRWWQWLALFVVLGSLEVGLVMWFT